MDGWTLSRDVRELLNEESTSGFIDSRTTYDYLYEAACDLNSQIHTLTAQQTITTVDGTRDYNLNADFLDIYMVNDNGKKYVKLYDGSNYYWVEYASPDYIYYLNNTDEVTIPSVFTIYDQRTPLDTITGTATADGDSTNGKCTLTDSTAPFGSITVGDMVHNTTDGSHGVVLAITSTSALVTSLFDGTDNEWDSADDYVIVPKGRKVMSFDPIPSTSGYYIYVEYVQKPAPVYSPYDTYRFDNSWKPALTKYAAWLYKYRDREPNYGDSWYKYYDNQIRKIKKGQKRSTFKVYLDRNLL